MNGAAAGATRLGIVYFDTSAVSLWPRLNPEQEECLQLARRFGVRLCLPRPVEAELRAHRLDDLERSERDLQRSATGILEAEDFALPGRRLMEARVRERFQALRAGWKVEIAPFPKPSVARLFLAEASRRRQRTAGRNPGFRDRVILASVVDHLRHEPGVAGILVAIDEGFNAEAVRETPGGKGAPLRIVRGFADVRSTLEEFLSGHEAAEREALRDTVKVLLGSRTEPLAAYLRHALRIPRDAFGPGRVAVSFPALRVRSVLPINVWMKGETASDRRMGAECTVALDLEVEFEPTFEQREMRVGDTPIERQFPPGVFDWVQGPGRSWYRSKEWVGAEAFLGVSWPAGGSEPESVAFERCQWKGVAS